MIRLLRLLSFATMLLLAMLPSRLLATHIVGGEMNYTCLGNDEYEITLTIFRDCFNGNPNAWFDNPASIGVFNADNELVDEILIPLMGNDTLNPVLTSECLVVPPDVCVHTTTYRATVTLPPIAGGYQLAYQRCCRNQTIVNIIDPLDTGATYGLTISESALEQCNSSPKFKDWPPIYICVNEPIVFDQSATDADGDSIVYRLCTPLTGATPDLPQPQPPNNPPYQEISWITPPYGPDNMLNGSLGGAVLQINPETGLLTGLPNTIGQFVVGICAEEYRNGELISTTRRDFQYNVGLCGQINAAYFAPEIQCGNLTVNFENQTGGAESFYWEFNDPGNPGASSVLSDPVYTFSDTGRYTVMLVAAPEETCADTFFREIYLQPESLLPGFEAEIISCSDTVDVQLTDLSADTLFEVAGWEWTVEPGGQSSELQNPVFSFAEAGSYNINLTVEGSNGCTAQVMQQIEVAPISQALTADTVVVCPGSSAPLNPAFNPAYTYSWASSPDIADTAAPSPVVSPDATTSYAVTITSADGSCKAEGEVTALVPPALTVAAPPDTLTCDAVIPLTAQSNTGTAFLWSEDAGFENIIGTGPSIEVSPFGLQTYYLLVRDSFGCQGIDSVQVQSNAVNAVISGQQAICPGSLGAATVINQDPQDELTIDWSPDELIILGGMDQTAFFQLPAPGTYDLQAEIENQFGCTLVAGTQLTLIDTLPQDSFQTVQQCSGYNVQFSSNSTNAPFYIWRFGDPNAPGAVGFGPQASHTYSEPGTYEVVITLSAFIACRDTIRQEITVEEPQIIPGFEYEITGCADTLQLLFADTSINNQSDIIDWSWNFGALGTASGSEAELTVNSSQDLPVTLTITSSDGCVDSITQIVPVEIPEPGLPDSLVACPGEQLALNPFPLEGYTYNWAPAGLFSDPQEVQPVVNIDESQLITVTLEQEDGRCALQREIYISVAEPLEYSLSNDTIACSEPVLLQAFSPQASAYRWSASPAFSSIISNEAEAEVESSGEQFFFVEITDELGCRTVDSVLVQGSNILVFTDPFVGICEGDSAELTLVNLLPEAGELFYDWAPDEAILGGQGSNTVTVAPGISQVFTVFITDELGCTESRSVNVTIDNELPPLQLEADQDTIFAPQQVQLFSTDDPGYIYEWSPAGPLSNSSVFNPIAKVDTTIEFSLRVVDANGCSNNGVLRVVLLSECLPPFIFVPNAFSPNGDLLNDELLVKGETIDELYFVIYNRWGEQVFETRDQTIGWDGTFRGRELSPDVYAYYLEARCFNGETYFEKGNITLIR